MSTVIYSSPVFGPIKSRRLGISLGINLLPEGGKVCTFDCIYCECGFNADRHTHNSLPTPEHVEDSLRKKITEMKKNNIIPDVLTFAGNGEPTIHPQFPQIAERVKSLRDELCPTAQMSILSNSTQIHRPEIREALMLFDNAILKLDSVDPEYITLVDRPTGHYDVEHILHNMELMQGHFILQIMFMKGNFQGKNVNNTYGTHLNHILEAISRVKPSKVMIYTIDRETPATELKKAEPKVLDNIATLIRERGYEVSVSY